MNFFLNYPRLLHLSLLQLLMPKKILVDKGNEFYDRSMKSRLQDRDIEIYSTCNEGKSVAAERFIRILESKIFKYTTSISKNVYFDK